MRQISTHRQTQLARVLGLAFVVAGFVVIGLGWNGAAKRTCVDCQMPYLLSGGAAGLGLILFGSTMLVVAQVRAERARLVSSLEDLVRGARGGERRDGPAEIGPDRVLAGPSTYHRPDCRLVQGKDDLEPVTVEAAAQRGLDPCRVCEPPALEAAGPETAEAADGEDGAEEPQAQLEEDQAGAPR